ncbi:MAG: reductive dehalogenase [candidate division Zixibacteria bacterium]|nr:reductive dehalogenase [candidate division Zixibacteria bacterium]
MIYVDIIFLLTGAIICAFLSIFAVASIGEKKLRAAILSAVLLVIVYAVWFEGYFIYIPDPEILLYILIAITLLFALFFLPIGQTRSMEIGELSEKVDERDIIFAREEYLPGTEKYEKYYSEHPELKDKDDRIRNLPELLEPGGKYYNPELAVKIGAKFEIIENMLERVDGEANQLPVAVDRDKMTSEIKDLTRRLGADDVGIAELDPMFVYSHVGRGPDKWGAPINNNHNYVIAFTMEMDYDHVEQAPRLPITDETATQYLRGALISIHIAAFIRSLGYPARAHIAGSNYQIMLPPAACVAGLGEMGRLGYLITPKFGPRIRLGAVTTDLPLVPDKPVKFGVQDFCRICKKCAINCPSGAIPTGDKTDVRGVVKWQLDIERCFHYWRAAGSDCGLCMRVCPFSHPPTFTHNIVRAGIKRSSFARRVSLWGDDIFYGKNIIKSGTLIE